MTSFDSNDPGARATEGPENDLENAGRQPSLRERIVTLVRHGKLDALFRRSWQATAVVRYGIALGISLLMVAVTFSVDTRLINFIPAVLLAALLGGWGPGLVVTFVCALVSAYVLLPPRYSFALQPLDGIAFIGFMVSGLLISWLVEILHRMRYRAERSESTLRAVQSITDAPAAQTNVDGLLGNLLSEIRAAVGGETATIFLLNDERTRLVATASVGLDQAARGDFSIAIAEDGAERMTEGAAQTALEGVIESEIVSRYLRTKAASLVGAPLRASGHLLGMIYVGSAQPERFTKDDGRLLAEIADRTALAIERARLLGAERMAKSDAEAANRTKDEFLAMLGHELRNPLSPMRTALQLMRLKGAHSREQDVLERQVDHLTRLVDDLLDVSRITRGKVELRKKTLELAEVVEQAIEIVRPLLEQGRHPLEVDVPVQGLCADVDPHRITQAISNLLSNASKYSEPGSRIGIRAERRGSEIFLHVKDEGIGLTPEMIGRVFELFVQEPQTLDRSRGGLGLGLSIARSIVTMHGGRMFARSEGRGEGSVFTIMLPAVDLVRSPAAPLDSVTPSQPARASRKRVLVVDDNYDAAETLKAALEQFGYTTEIAHDGPEALRVAQSFQPDVALVDIGLPVMDGYELAERLRTRGDAPKLHLIAVTGYGQEADRRRSKSAGFERHLVKPVDLMQLEQIVHDIAP